MRGLARPCVFGPGRQGALHAGSPMDGAEKGDPRSGRKRTLRYRRPVRGFHPERRGGLFEGIHPRRHGEARSKDRGALRTKGGKLHQAPERQGQTPCGLLQLLYGHGMGRRRQFTWQHWDIKTR